MIFRRPRVGTLSLAELLKDCEVNGAVSDEVLRATCAALPLSDEYLELVRIWDGAQGEVGQGWLILYPVSNLVEMQDLYKDSEHLSRFVIFGSNGGGEAYCLDEQGAAWVVPWIGGVEDAIPQGSILNSLNRMHAGRILER